MTNSLGISKSCQIKHNDGNDQSLLCARPWLRRWQANGFWLATIMMRLTWKYAALAALICLFAITVFANSEAIHACECVEPDSAEERRDEATAIFLGRVVDIHFEDWPFDIETTAVPPEEPMTVEFRVHNVWKGEVSRVTRLTTARSEPCGFPFKMFEDFLVYADGKTDSLEVGACSRTQPAIDAAEDLETLGEGYSPGPGSRGVVRPATLDCFATSGSAHTSLDTWPLILIAGVAWFGIRKHRRR